jgi:hypothetical protein
MDSSFYPSSIHPSIYPWTPHFSPSTRSSMDSSFYPVNIHSYHSSIGFPFFFFFSHPLLSFWTPYSTAYSFIHSSTDSLLAPLFYSSIHSFIHSSIHPSINSFVGSLTLESQNETFVLRRSGSFGTIFFFGLESKQAVWSPPLGV